MRAAAPFCRVCRFLIAAASVCLFYGSPDQASAQFAVGGVYVDAEGMLRHASRLSRDERLKLLRSEAFARPDSPQLAASSALRKVSLSRLQRHVQTLHAENRPLPAEVRYLAGLHSVKYVLFYPEQNDVVLAGPAEGWRGLSSGEVVGRKSNRPVLQLDDLIVALRFAFRDRAPGAGRTTTTSRRAASSALASPPATPGFIGCSIEPTAEGMQNYADYLKRIGRIDRSRLTQIFAGMEQAMGPQQVRLFGVPESSRFAMKMVAADYRLKRIALGHDPSPVKQVTNYLDLKKKTVTGGPQLQHRWWFVGQYDALLHTADRLAFELQGQGLRVATAPTSVDEPTADENDAETRGAPRNRGDAAARRFATAMTRHFPEVARRVPVFAELQNLVALSVAAELIAQHGRDEVEAWRPTAFLQDEHCPLQPVPVPRQVPSLVNYRFAKNRYWLISISGGVEIDPRTMLARRQRRQAGARRILDSARSNSRPPATGPRWWWD